MGIYKHLYKGNVIEFDLCHNLTKCVCKNDKDHTVSNVTTFTITTQYIRNPEDKLFIN